MSHHATPTVEVILASYKDWTYLPAQIASIANQDYPNIRLVITRDCDTPQVQQAIDKAAADFPRLQILTVRGPQKGFSPNFLFTLADRATSSAADYFAFSDQDDIWPAGKISQAIKALELAKRQEAPRTALTYSCRQTLINQEGAPIGLSPLYRAPFNLGNALVENVACGHTLVMNRSFTDQAAIAINRLRHSDTLEIPFHDWWVYAWTCAIGGKHIYDATALSGYRQHSANTVGNGDTAWRHFGQLSQLWRGTYLKSLKQLSLTLDTNRSQMTDEAVEMLDHFMALHQKNRFKRIAGIRNSGVKRQGRMNQIVFPVLVFLSPTPD